MLFKKVQGDVVRRYCTGTALVLAAMLPMTGKSQQWNAVGPATGISGSWGSYQNIAKDATGNLYVSFYDGSVSKGSVMKYNGTAWAHLGGTAGITAGTATFNALSVATNGDVFYCNQAGFPAAGINVRKFSGTAWTSLPDVESATSNFQAMVSASDNQPVIAYSVGGSPKVKKYNGTAWNLLGTGLPTGVPYYLDLVAGTNDSAYVSFVGSTGLKVYKISMAATTTDVWQELGTTGFTATSSEQFRSAMAIDASNNIYIAFTSNTASGNKINVKKYSAGQWTDIGAANFSAFRVHHVSIAISATGVPYVAYSHFENSPNNKNVVMKFNGTQWETVGAAVSDGEAKWNALLIDNSGNPVLSYNDEGMTTGGNMVKKFNSATLTLVDSVKVNTANNVAPIVTSSVVATQPASVLQLESVVYPLSVNQGVSWQALAGTTATVNTSGLVTVPTQISGLAWFKASSTLDPAKSDSLRLQVYCKPNTGNSNFFKFDTVSIAGTTLNYYTPNNLINYNFIPEAPNATATLSIGQSYGLHTAIRPSIMSASGYSYSMWIDYNRNGVFDATEYTELVGSAGTLDTFTNFTFTVPTGAVAGKTLMRLKTRLAGGANDAASVCGGLTNSGHIQDFIVTLSNGPVTGITSVDVTTQNNIAATVTTNGGTLQMTSVVLPATANQGVTWSIASVTGSATISASGLLTATGNGTVYARAISVQDASKSDSLLVTLSNQVVNVTSVDVTVTNNLPATITTNNGTLQLQAIVLPAAASQNVTWSLVPVTGSASVSTTGLVTAATNGTVWAKAISVQDATKADSVLITISNQVIAITSVDVTVANNLPATITTNNGTLQLQAMVLPVNAVQDVTWSVVPVTGAATISTSGLLEADVDGTVWAKAVSVQDATKSDSILVTLTNQVVDIVSVSVSVANSLPAIITTDNGTLQMSSAVLPANAVQDVVWSIVPMTGSASISTAGLITADADGTIWAKAVSVQDATKSDSLLITISNQVIEATSIVVATANNADPAISTNAGTLQMTATILPATASQAVVWSIVAESGSATISAAGLVTAVTNGTVLAKAVSVQNAAVTDAVRITISGQNGGTAIDDVDYGLGFTMYPNPVAEQVTLKMEGQHPALSVSIIDLSGRLCTLQQTAANQLNRSFSLATTQLVPGSYLIAVKGPGINIVRKFVKR